MYNDIVCLSSRMYDEPVVSCCWNVGIMVVHNNNNNNNNNLLLLLIK